MQRVRTVSVIGPSLPEAASLPLAEELGRGLGERGHALVCGGRGGVMEAACRGARTAGGLTVGLLPGTEAAQANPWVALALPTGLGHARNLTVALAGEVVVAIGLSAGTLTEVAFAALHDRPLLALPPHHDLPLVSWRLVETAAQALAEIDHLLGPADGSGERSRA